MNDFDEAMVSMWKSLDPEPLQLNCYIHLERNVKRRSLPKDMKKRILDDIIYLSESSNEDEFIYRWQLVKESWSCYNNDLVTEFTNYFENQYISKHKNWYLGICPIGLGNTNNALEGFNRAFKENYSEYQRQDIVRSFNFSLNYFLGSVCENDEGYCILYQF